MSETRLKEYANELGAATTEKAEQEKASGNLGAGILGAAIGALVGAITEESRTNTAVTY